MMHHERMARMRTTRIICPMFLAICAHHRCRLCSVVMFLGTLGEGQGGELVFPLAEPLPPVEGTGSEGTVGRSSFTHSNCASRSAIAVRPQRGDAVLYWSSTDGQNPDPKAKHSFCPTKDPDQPVWTATKYFRTLDIYDRD